MKLILSFFCLMLFHIGFSQQKKIKYLNEIYEEINPKEFIKAKKTGKYLDLYFENDTLIQCLLVRRRPIGKLNKNQFEKLKENLQIKNTIEDDLVVIIYYPGKDSCNKAEKYSTWNVFDSDYLKKLKKISGISHHWIYKDDENLKYYYKRKIGWKKDKNQFIEKLFFKYHYPCFSFVVIDSKGNYMAYYGEFGKQTVWELAKTLKKAY
ncbi:hypothetical protein [Corallibacter sp.]|uniref:hypothetical protein n=1 Tax=Corallibacter sp. TaxID=2038084 RepID=UPI003AB244FA